MCIERKGGSVRPSVVCDEARDIIEAMMNEDDETTATQLMTRL